MHVCVVARVCVVRLCACGSGSICVRVRAGLLSNTPPAISLREEFLFTDRRGLHPATPLKKTALMKNLEFLSRKKQLPPHGADSFLSGAALSLELLKRAKPAPPFALEQRATCISEQTQVGGGDPSQFTCVFTLTLRNTPQRSRSGASHTRPGFLVLTCNGGEPLLRNAGCFPWPQATSCCTSMASLLSSARLFLSCCRN